MPPAPDIDSASLIVSTVVLLVAALLGWSEWRERRRRDSDLPEQDLGHFASQDARRAFGIVVLVLLAVGVIYGSRLPPRLDNRANPRFVGLWLGVFLLIFVLLALAFRDWVALRRYAIRHRGQILRERIEILRDEARRQRESHEDDNGHGDGPLRDLFH